MKLEGGYFPDVIFSSLPPRPDSGEIVGSPNPSIYFVKEKIAYGDAYLIFCDTIKAMREDLGVDLPLINRYVHFISYDQLIENIDREAQELRDGPNSLKNLVGSCVRKSDGTFDLKVVVSDMGYIPDLIEALVTLGHEYGHSLGPDLPEVEEEMKAYLFERFFMMNLLEIDLWELDGQYSDSLHEVAQDRINQLNQRGFPDGAIFSHLIGSPFGAYKPDSNMQIPSL